MISYKISVQSINTESKPHSKQTSDITNIISEFHDWFLFIDDNGLTLVPIKFQVPEFRVRIFLIIFIFVDYLLIVTKYSSLMQSTGHKFS